MPIFANINPTAGSDGSVYCTSVPLTSNEADLGDGLKTPAPIQILEGQEIAASVVLTINGSVVGNTSYVILQTEYGDGNWIDVAWIVPTFNQGTVKYFMSGGGRGAMNNAVQQTRQAGQPPTPQTSGSSTVPLGGRVRFVGKSSFTGGSSSLAGQTTSVLASIAYKLTAPR